MKQIGTFFLRTHNMGNDLVPQTENAPLVEYDKFLASNVEYLPRLQLFGSKSDAVTEEKIDIAHWGLVLDQDITDLGKEVDVILVDWRPKAMDTSGDVPIISHDPESELFEEIIGKSTIRNSGCMFGPEFLVWIPETQQFATYFMSSKTARREAKKMKPLLNKGATLKSQLIDNGRYKWHGPVALPCTNPLTPPETVHLTKQRVAFQNPPVQEVAEEDDRDR
ncbi:MAG: hypothetical protein ACFFCQ_09220 [Promethearchaeota archaeon]